MTAASLPHPPLSLANRVGSLAEATDPLAYYDDLGRRIHDDLVAQLPPDWSFAGNHVLDFGCGAGRTLRHFTPEAEEATIWGCDIDDASVVWMEEHMCPPFHVFTNAANPPLVGPQSGFDLIWAVSVFTHLTDNWSSWLAELHRQLSPDGLLLVTFMGSGMVKMIANEEWNEAHYGMNVLKYEQGWELGGPMVLHAPWWIEEHWGRAFEIVSLLPDGFASQPSTGQGSVLMRKRDVAVTAEMLEEIKAGDTRELRAIAHNLSQAKAECGQLRQSCAHLQSLLSADVEHRRDLEIELGSLAASLEVVKNSRSWRLTRPLRTVAERVRARVR